MDPSQDQDFGIPMPKNVMASYGAGLIMTTQIYFIDGAIGYQFSVTIRIRKRHLKWLAICHETSWPSI